MPPLSLPMVSVVPVFTDECIHHMNTNSGRPKELVSRASDPLRVCRSPAVRQQFIELLNRALPDAREHILEPGERVHLR